MCRIVSFQPLNNSHVVIEPMNSHDLMTFVKFDILEGVYILKGEQKIPVSISPFSRYGVTNKASPGSTPDFMLTPKCSLGNWARKSALKRQIQLVKLVFDIKEMIDKFTIRRAPCNNVLCLKMTF